MNEIEKAIKTIKVAIAEVDWNYPLDYAIAFETAIEVLREKLEREKGCEHCNTVEHVNGHYRNFYKAFPHDNDDKVFTSLDYADLSIAYDKESGWVLHYEDTNGDRMFDVKINRCPHCGRKLGEENV